MLRVTGQRLLLPAAREMLAEQGADKLTMDALAREYGRATVVRE